MRARHVVWLAAVLSGCGGPGSISSLPDASDAFPAVYRPIGTATFALPPGAATAIDVDVPRTDVLYATLDWTSSRNTVVAALTPETCDNVNSALGERCYGDFATSVSMCEAKPRTVRLGLFQPHRVRLWIANQGTTAESGVVQFTTCDDTPGCGAAAACAQCISDHRLASSCPH